MTMNSMDQYLKDRGFIVNRSYLPERKEYRFDISKNGVTKTYFYKWEYRKGSYAFDQYQKESMDAMIKDFNEKVLIDIACNSLVGSIDSGYVYNPNMDVPSVVEWDPVKEEFITKMKEHSLQCLYPQTMSIKDYNKAYDELNDYIDKKVRNMLEIPELNNRTLEIKDVIFNDPATIVFWNDGTKTVVKAVNEDFDREKGLAMAITKKFFGNKGNYYNNVKKWLE